MDPTFASLVNQHFKPQSDRARREVEAAMHALAERMVLKPRSVGDDAVRAIEYMVADIDLMLSEQINPILHHPDFQALEGTWRGLHYLLNNTETDETLKVRVLSISKKDLSRTLRKFAGAAWDQSPIFKKLYQEEFSQFGGEPYGCLVGDYYFDHSPADVELLAHMAKIAAAIHAPFLAAAAPSLLGLDSWQDLGRPFAIGHVFATPEYAGWRSLRESDDARYIGLTVPRFLARRPYGTRGSPVDEFDLEEETNGGDQSRYTWANAAYAMAANITRSFKVYGWFARIRGIESGGTVEGLPTDAFPGDDGSTDSKCPTEIAITDRREAELSQQGFMPLAHRKNSDVAFFIGAQSLQRPQSYDDPDATANANLAARLPYLLAVCRFAHYTMCIARDQIGTLQTREEIQSRLQSWISQYADGDPQYSSEDGKARKPLAAAEVVIDEAEGNPGRYFMKLFLRPHYQLEGLTVSLRVTAYLPSAKAA